MSSIREKIRLEELLNIAASRDASDLHFAVGHHPTLRIDGELVPLLEKPLLEPEDTMEIAQSFLSEAQREELLREREIDLSFAFKEKLRLRTNVFFQSGFVSIAFRFIPKSIRTVKELNLPPVLSSLVKRSQGLILVVGPAGQGKTTTLAAFIEEINTSRTEHIITIEDPIEYVFTDRECIIDQREVHSDTLSFARALRSALRQDPDVVLVGEMRDLETIASVATLAETGHLVLSTLHTNDAPQTIDRIIDVFPEYQQDQIRAQLASVLVAIVSQRLVPRIQGGRVPAVELLVQTPAVAHIIREGKTHQLGNVIQTSADMGMIPLEQSLAQLVRSGQITLESAKMVAVDQKSLATYLGGYAK
ncbi:MAG: type IV pilus twitching motility protein PilT [Parcubacteria group bacterium]|nr:type IV pilus twitching motility protein PilT [Parcubacteria group bacterium]